VLIRVLGAAAGGGFPQWNCGCDNCRAVRAGDSAFRALTQESVAVSADGDAWFLINASPEIRSQIEAFERLWPRAPRHSPIGGLLLTNGDLDHCLGLFSLRESQPLVVHATESVRAGLVNDNVFYRTLERFPGQVTWRSLDLDEELPLGDGALRVTAVAVHGKVPLHLEGRRAPSAGDNVGLVIRDTRSGGRLAYFSTVAGPSEALSRGLDEASVVFFDGTFWSSDELIRAGLGTRRAEDMAHWPTGGKEGSLSLLASQKKPTYLIHVNNTNPVLREDGAERLALRQVGVEVAYDGLELTC
jgi:pyrroloquinoline quinone biosynthesis protein B